MKATKLIALLLLLVVIVSSLASCTVPQELKPKPEGEDSTIIDDIYRDLYNALRDVRNYFRDEVFAPAETK